MYKLISITSCRNLVFEKRKKMVVRFESKKYLIFEKRKEIFLVLIFIFP